MSDEDKDLSGICNLMTSRENDLVIFFFKHRKIFLCSSAYITHDLTFCL